MGKRVPESAKVVGKKLRTLREGAGLSLKDISKILDVSYQQVQKYEQGVNRFPVEKLFQLKQFYGLDYEDFFSCLTRSGAAVLDVKHDEMLGYFVRVGRMRDSKRKRQIRDVVAILVE